MKNLYTLLLFILIIQMCLSSCNNKITLQYNHSTLDSIYNSDNFEKAWHANDTVFILAFIDSLEKLDYPKIILVCNRLSETTGFAWAIWSNENLEKYDTLSLKQKYILKKNIIDGFKIYRKSPLFMVKIPEVILMYSYFYFDEHRLLTEEEKIRVMRFLEDICDNKFRLK